MKHYDESKYQEQVVYALQRFYKHVMFTGGFAGERLDGRAAIRRNRMGYRAGTPDIIVLEARGGFHGLLVEMKSSTGRQTPEQKLFQQESEARGYCYKVCKSTQDGVDAITEYMALK